MRTRWLLAAAGLIALATGTGCVDTKIEQSDCARASDTLVGAIQERVHDGRLRHGSVLVEGPYTFVSAEMLRPDQDEDRQGDLLTFVTGDATQADGWRAVDEYAIEHSGWPRAPFDVTKAGAIDSRGCVSYWWGEEYEPEDVVKEKGDPKFCFEGGDCEDKSGADSGSDGE